MFNHKTRNFSHNLSYSFPLWRHRLKTLLFPNISKPESEQNTEINISVVSISLHDLERNMRWAGLELSSRCYCWKDMKNRDSASISEAVAFQLRQNLVTIVENNVYTLSDPSSFQILQLCRKLDEFKSCSRCLFIFNGHGTPEPITENSLKLMPDESNFNDGETTSELKIKDLVKSINIPCCYIFDTDFCGGLYQELVEADGNKDRYAFFACSSCECLPHRIELPADLFTSCLLTPGLVAMLWESRQFYAFGSEGLHQFPLSYFADDSYMKPHLLLFSFEIERILECLVKAMACSVLKPLTMYHLFYRDKKVGKLYVNFCLARRIGSELGFTPMCYPDINDFSRNQLWDFFDLYLDSVLLRLTQIEKSIPVTQTEISNDMIDFLTDLLITIEHSLEFNFFDTEISEISLMPMILSENALMARGLNAFIKFIDVGEQTLKAGLCYGILDVLLSMPFSSNTDLLLPVSYCFAKLLVYSIKSNEQLSIFGRSGIAIIPSLISAFKKSEYKNPLYITLALIILVSGLLLKNKAEAENININLFSIFLKLIGTQNKTIKFWILLFVSQYLLYTEKGNQQLLKIPIFGVILNASKDQSCELRASFLLALTSLLRYEPKILLSISSPFLKIISFYKNDYSHLVRSQLLYLLNTVLIQHKSINLETDMKTEILNVLNYLLYDPYPEIAMYDKEILEYLQNGQKESNFSLETTLILGAFDDFLISQYSNLEENIKIPFSLKSNDVDSMPIIPSNINVASKNIKFTEIDYFQFNNQLVSNIVFYGSEKALFGDSKGNLILRNYGDHSNELSHPISKLFSPYSSSYQIHKLISIGDDSLLVSNKNGDIFVISNILSVSPVVSDCFHLNTIYSSKRYDPVIEYNKNSQIFYSSVEPGVILQWDAICSYMRPQIKINDSNIKTICCSPNQEYLLGIASNDLRFLDIREPGNSVIKFKVEKEPRDFKPMKYLFNQYFVSYEDGTLSLLDIRMSDQEHIIKKGVKPFNIDVCPESPISLYNDGSLYVTDFYSTQSYSVIDDLYPSRNRATKLNFACFHPKKSTIALTVDDNSFLVVGVVVN